MSCVRLAVISLLLLALTSEAVVHTIQFGPSDETPFCRQNNQCGSWCLFKTTSEGHIVHRESDCQQAPLEKPSPHLILTISLAEEFRFLVSGMEYTIASAFSTSHYIPNISWSITSVELRCKSSESSESSHRSYKTRKMTFSIFRRFLSS